MGPLLLQPSQEWDRASRLSRDIPAVRRTLTPAGLSSASPNYLCLRRKDSPPPECPTYALCFSPSLGHLADGRSPAGPYLLLLDPQVLSLGSSETGGRHLSP